MHYNGMRMGFGIGNGDIFDCICMFNSNNINHFYSFLHFRYQVKCHLILFALHFNYPEAFSDVGLAQNTNFSHFLTKKHHYLVTDLGNHGLQVGLIYLYVSSSQGDFSKKWLYSSIDLAFLVMEGRVYLMRLYSDDNSLSNPFYFLLFRLISFILLQFLIQPFNVIKLCLALLQLLMNLYFQFLCGIKGRSFLFTSKAFNAELKPIGNGHVLSFFLKFGLL